MMEYDKTLRQWAQDKQYRRQPELPDDARFIKSATSNNCGDTISLYCIVSEDYIYDIGYTGDGCRLFFAATHQLCKWVHTMSCERVCELAREMTDAMQNIDDSIRKFGIGEEFSYMISEFPGRRECILLPWRAILECLKAEGEQYA